MRRFFLVLGVCLLTVTLLVTGLSARAERQTIVPRSTPFKDIPVNVKINSPSITPAPTVYSVTLEWGSMNFEYTPTATQTWDSTYHRLDDDYTGGTWFFETGANRIVITNDSNAQIGYNVLFEPLQEYTNYLQGNIQYKPTNTAGEPIDFGKDEKYLLDRSTAVSEGDYSNTVYLTLSGTFPDETVKQLEGTSTKMGTLTIDLSVNNS